MSLSFTVLQGEEGVRGRPGAPGEKVSAEQSLDHTLPLFERRFGLTLFLFGSSQGELGPVGPAGLPGLDGPKGPEVSRHKQH